MTTSESADVRVSPRGLRITVPPRLRQATLLLTLTALSLSGAADEIVPQRGLAIGRVSSGGRAPVHTNAIEAMVAAGEWTMPAEGDEIELPGGRTRTWNAIEANENGRFQDRALRGGYVSVPVESDRRRIMLLEARGGFGNVRVNGVPRAGDTYNTGWIHLPVRLERGTNEFLYHVSRGWVQMRLHEPAAPIMLDLRDATLPDLIIDDNEPKWGALLLLNATEQTQHDLRIVAHGPDGASTETPVASIPPLTTKKVPFRIDWTPPTGPGETTVELEVLDGDDASHWTQTITLRHASGSERHSRTFVSSIDGSVQYYAVQPPPEARDESPGLILTLHGASVEGANQRNQYGPKPWAWVVAPTNRRPFGFDWEDWGRMDAMEVMTLASARYGTDPRRQWLTGHSMGGHGTWILGATYPDRFAALGPSAGWISFWSYSSARDYDDPTPVDQMLRRATNASDTLELSHNYAHQGVYILHGDQDDNVPLAQARTMVKHLAEFHPSFAYHEQPGAGHWWGSQCCDWPPMMDFFQEYTIPAAKEVREVSFVTASPGVSPRFHWATIHAQDDSMAFSHIDLRHDEGNGRIEGSTENIRRLALDFGLLGVERPIALELDGETIEAVTAATDGLVRLSRERDGWQVVDGFSAELKSPERSGPFKEAFRNDVLFVYGTQGIPGDNAWALAKARYDAETFWYRGNGSIDVVADTEFDPAAEPDRNVILYGNADTNSAWNALLDQCPIQVRSGEAHVGERRIEGDDLGLLFLRPRPGSDTASVGVVSGTGRHGMSLTTRLPYFVSGVAYPDWFIVDRRSLTEGTAGVVGAGFFGHDWSVESGDTAWREE